MQHIYIYCRFTRWSKKQSNALYINDIHTSNKRRSVINRAAFVVYHHSPRPRISASVGKDVKWHMRCTVSRSITSAQHTITCTYFHNDIITAGGLIMMNNIASSGWINRLCSTATGPFTSCADWIYDIVSESYRVYVLSSFQSESFGVFGVLHTKFIEIIFKISILYLIRKIFF